MKKGFYQKISMMAIPIFFMAVWPCVVSASVSVTIIRPESKGESAAVIDLAAMAPFTVDLETTDPNFKNNGRVRFSGIYLEKLLALANAPVDPGVTVVGKDQYVEYIPLDKGMGKRVILAFAMGGQPISRLEGGPLKIMYDAAEGGHGSGYTWYVETILTGKIENPDVIVAADGVKKNMFCKDLIPMAKDLDVTRVSIPSGSRQGFPGPKFLDKNTAVVGLYLNDLLEQMGITPKGKLSLVTFAGPELILSHALLDYPITLVCAMAGGTLHPVFGGPFSIQFPIEDYPEIRELLPESGAFFFLRQITVH